MHFPVVTLHITYGNTTMTDTISMSSDQKSSCLKIIKELRARLSKLSHCIIGRPHRMQLSVDDIWIALCIKFFISQKTSLFVRNSDQKF